MKTNFFVLFFASCLSTVWSQITQSHPEYCGTPGNLNPPLPAVTATIDSNSGIATLFIGSGALALQDGLVSEVSEICPLSDGRLIVFGEIPRYEGIAEDIFIVDPAKNSLVDSFMAYRPVISPNQRWIAYVKFAPYYVEASTEIMLYDLSKSPAQNRPRSDPVHPNDEKTDAGTIVFPPGHENFDGSNILDSPSDTQMVHAAGKLHWAPDSRAIVFTDMVADNPAIVLVTLDDHGTSAAFRHALTEAEICGRDTPAGNRMRNLKLDRAEFQSSGVIALDIGTSSDACAPHVLQLWREEFQAAATELHVKPAYPPGERLPNGEVRVPKKKKER